ncbi:MAG: peptidylprolyl isomerase [Bacteroidetes bacterium]|nr:peptidylprolyl isomerase [Bacteroidota bacterium]
MSKIKNQDHVKVHYTGTLDDGQVFDSSESREPLEFVVGEGMLIPGFENAVIGMELNETKTVKIPHDEAYGHRHEGLIQEVPNAMLPSGLNPELGMELMSKQDDGQEMVVRIVEVKPESIVIDANHPLAGEDLTFEIKVVGIN